MELRISHSRPGVSYSLDVRIVQRDPIGAELASRVLDDAHDALSKLATKDNDSDDLLDTISALPGVTGGATDVGEEG